MRNMLSENSRPILINLSLEYLLITLLAHLLILYGTTTTLLASGFEGWMVFGMGLAAALLQVLTLESVRKRANVGRRLAIIRSDGFVWNLQRYCALQLDQSKWSKSALSENGLVGTSGNFILFRLCFREVEKCGRILSVCG